jgi:hypothetical protein
MSSSSYAQSAASSSLAANQSPANKRQRMDSNVSSSASGVELLYDELINSSEPLFPDELLCTILSSAGVNINYEANKNNLALLRLIGLATGKFISTITNEAQFFAAARAKDVSANHHHHSNSVAASSSTLLLSDINAAAISLGLENNNTSDYYTDNQLLPNLTNK